MSRNCKAVVGSSLSVSLLLDKRITYSILKNRQNMIDNQVLQLIHFVCYSISVTTNNNWNYPPPFRPNITFTISFPPVANTL